jgi:hypothetical protein
LALLVQYLRYCHPDCSVSFFHCSLFQLVVLHVGHVLASNCDLYFGYLLNFALDFVPHSGNLLTQHTKINYHHHWK